MAHQSNPNTLDNRMDDCIFNALPSAVTVSIFVKTPVVYFVSHVDATHVPF